MPRADLRAALPFTPTPARARLLVVSHSHPQLSRGGAEIAAYEQFRRAAAVPGAEAWFLGSNGAAHGGKTGTTLHQPFGPREWLHSGHRFEQFRLSNPDPAFEAEFGALLGELRPDIVHFHHYLGVGVEAFLYVRRYAPDARIVLTLHEYLLICNHFGQMVTRPDFNLCPMASPQRCHRCFPEHGQRAFFLRELWLKRFLREVDAFVSPSDFLRERYIAWGLPADRITVAENMLPLYAQPEPQARPASNFLRVAYFGQLSPLKGIDVLLRAARRAEQRALPISFRIYGSSESQPNSFQKQVKEALEQLPANVAFKGPYRNNDVVRLMAENDVVVVPSIWWENSPLTIQEARLAGCIILGSDIGGVREKVEQAEHGLTFGVGDADDLVERLAVILTEREVESRGARWPEQRALRQLRPGDRS